MNTLSEEVRKKKNEKLANKLKTLVERYKLGDVSIYFNGICYRWNSSGEMQVLEDIKGSTYFEYANDETVSMSFEGMLYHVFNYGVKPAILKAIDKVFEKEQAYYEFGYAWSLSTYYDEDITV